MPDDLDIYNEDDSFQRGDDDDDEDDNDDRIPNGSDDDDDEFIEAIMSEPEYLLEMHRLMFEHGP